MLNIILGVVYIISAALFISGLKMLSKPGTARQGNMISALGMFLAIVATLSSGGLSWEWIALGIVIGSVIGALAARLVAMTSMPEMVAIFNGFGGIASLLVGLAVYTQSIQTGEVNSIQQLTVYLSVLIGGVTFTGSLIAYGKLGGYISAKPLMFVGQKVVNIFLLLLIIAGGVLIVAGSSLTQFTGPIDANLAFFAVIILSLIFGVMAVIPIGGADMPVVISLLNSYSGLAAAAAGFALFPYSVSAGEIPTELGVGLVLIVSGSLVGASGIILTNIMCKAMNRSLANVLFSGFGSATSSSSKKIEGEAKPINVEDAFVILEAAKSVAIVPGYGMAVAQAQHVVRELGEQLEENGCEVNYGIHPVAGRMPGHMNVLLAEANVPYDQLREMDAINPNMENVDVAIVIGANDVVNPAAREEEGSPIYGMPIINVDKARTVFVLKRSMASGFAGIDNPLFFKPNTRMLFGDAKSTVQGLVSEFKS